MCLSGLKSEKQAIKRFIQFGFLFLFKLFQGLKNDLFLHITICMERKKCE